MKDLVLAQEELFQGIHCDLWMDSKRNPFMTIQQMADALEYGSKSGIENIITRNPYLKDKEFSSTHRLGVLEGKRIVQRETLVFTKDGIMELAFLSHKPKAREFRAWARKVLTAFMDGQIIRKERREDVKQKLNILRDVVSQHYPKEKVAIEIINFNNLLCLLITGEKSVQGYKKKHGIEKGSFPELIQGEDQEKYVAYVNKIAVLLDAGLTRKQIKKLFLEGDEVSLTIQTKELEEAK